MSESRRHTVFVVASACFVLTALAAVEVPAFELWPDDIPEIPEGARSYSTYRTVTALNGVRLVARSRRFERVRRQADGSIVRRVYDADGGYLWDTTFEYDGEHLVQIRAADSRERWRLEFEYDSAGRPIREIYIAGDGAPERTIVYEYGVLATEVISYRADGSVAWRRTESHGEAGEERETTFYYADGTRIKTIVAITDEAGFVIHERHLDELGATYREVERSWSDDGPVEEVVFGDANALVRHTRWEYDDAGRLVSRWEQLPSEDREERLVVRYTVDDRGHWIERLATGYARYEGEEGFMTDQELLERQIEYQ